MNEIITLIIPVLGLLATATSIVLPVRESRAVRQKKALSYGIISQVPLVSVAEQVRSQLQLTYQGQPVGNVHAVELRVTNTGNVPIPAADFEKPMTNLMVQ